jgi:hypothetical protein
MNRALLWFVRVWVGIAIAVNVIAVAGFFMSAHGFWDGWHRVAEIYSPFNLTNYLMEVALLSPAIGAYAWLQRRTKRETGPPQSMSAEEVQQIVNAYGDAMTKPPFFPCELYSGPIPEGHPIRQQMNELLAKGPLRDLRTLPYPKERIKQALLMAIALTPPGDTRGLAGHPRERPHCGHACRRQGASG